jgi:hypothetical protein
MTGPTGARAADALGAALWLLVAQAGHHGCNGWTYEQRDGLVACACGAALYELHDLAEGGLGGVGG